MVLCLMVGCGNKSGKSCADREKVRFFRVPRVVTNQGEFVEETTSTRRREWISAISRQDLTEEKLENDRVCSKHFVSGQPAKEWDRFNVDWVPSLNLGHSKRREEAGKGAERAERATQRRKRREEQAQTEIAEKVKRVNEPGKCVQELFLDPGPVEDAATDDAQEQRDREETATSRPNVFSHDATTQTPSTSTGASTSEIGTQTSEFEYLFKEAKTQPFTEEYFSNSDDKVRFYTGLPSFDTMMTIFGFVEPYVSRRTKTLTSFQEFVMVLMKLRLNVPQQDLAYRFDISQPTVSRIFLAWMTTMDIRMTPLIKWPEREELRRTMPRCFQFSFGRRVTIIIDCFEVSIERPSNLLARAQTFSHYKHRNTIKVLIGITPQGSICFVSKAWGGRTSDKYLTENCRFLDNLTPGDLVMADRGFTIHESLGLHQAQLAIPAYTRGKNQLDPIDIEKTRGIANVHIHVERVIGLLKQKYTMLQGTLSIDYLMLTANSPEPMVDRIIRVCSALVNMCPPIVPFD